MNNTFEENNGIYLKLKFSLEHDDKFISVFNQLDAQNLFHNSFISCLHTFRAHVLIIKRSKLHYTASGIVTSIGARSTKLLKKIIANVRSNS